MRRQQPGSGGQAAGSGLGSRSPANWPMSRGLRPTAAAASSRFTLSRHSYCCQCGAWEGDMAPGQLEPHQLWQGALGGGRGGGRAATAAKGGPTATCCII